MNKGKISNFLRRTGLLYAFDKFRFYLEKYKNDRINKSFKKENPSVKLPPDYLMYESFQLNFTKYYFGGKETAEWILGLFEKHMSINGKKILDWGCGPARVLRHMPEITKNEASFYGSDYNKHSISWCRENIKNIDFNLNKLKADLPYENDFFNGIYVISIFTHLSEKMHYEWFQELKRVLASGGLIILTTQGENFKHKLSPDERGKFDQGNLIVRGNVKEGHRTYSAFHPDQFLEELFIGMELLEKIVIDPEGKGYTPQDVWILRKNSM